MRYSIFAALIGISYIISSPAQAVIIGDEKSVKVSCTQNGRIVYPQKELTETEAHNRRKMITEQFPNAMCIFLEKSQSKNNDYQDDKYTPGTDDELLTALAVISSGKTGERYPDDISKLFSDKKKIFSSGNGQEKNNEIKDKERGYINLTLGVYKNLTMNDVLAHWKVMQKDANILKKMTPTFDTVENIIVMSILKVPDELANQVCKEASQKGQGCIAFF